MTLPEVLLWQRLRRRAGTAKFRRQHPVGGCVVDFYCAAAGLVVEIDGQIHSLGAKPIQDAARDAALSALGLRVVRIPAANVFRDVNATADAILALALPLHHRHAAGGPPPHPADGEDLR